MPQDPKNTPDNGNNNDSPDPQVLLERLEKLEKTLSSVPEMLQKITEQQQPKTPETPEDGEGGSKKGNLTLKSVQSQVEALEKQLEDKERQIALNKRDDKIKSFLQEKNISHTDAAHKLFVSDFEDNLVQEDGDWFVKKGEDVKSLEKALEEFVERPEITAFKESRFRPGGIRAPQKTPGKSSENQSLNEQILSAFEDI